MSILQNTSSQAQHRCLHPLWKQASYSCSLPLDGLLCHSRTSLPTPLPSGSSKNLWWKVFQRGAWQTKHTDWTSQHCSGSYGSIKLHWSQQLTANMVLITMYNFQLFIKTRWIVNYQLHLTAKTICSFPHKKKITSLGINRAISSNLKAKELHFPSNISKNKTVIWLTTSITAFPW